MSSKEIKPGAESAAESKFKKLKSKKEKGYDVYKEAGPSDGDATDKEVTSAVTPKK